MSTKHTPGPWRTNYEAGAPKPWAVHRINRNFKPGLGRIETLKASDGEEARFWTEEEARAAISFVEALDRAKARAAIAKTTEATP